MPGDFDYDVMPAPQKKAVYASAKEARAKARERWKRASNPSERARHEADMYTAEDIMRKAQ